MTFKPGIKEAYTISQFGGVNFTYPQCDERINNISLGQLTSIQEKSNSFLHSCCYSYQPPQEIIQIITSQARELQEYVERSRLKEKHDSFRRGVVVAGLFGIAPMMFGVLFQDYEVALQGTIFIIIMFVIIGWWKWTRRG